LKKAGKPYPAGTGCKAGWRKIPSISCLFLDAGKKSEWSRQGKGTEKIQKIKEEARGQKALSRNSANTSLHIKAGCPKRHSRRREGVDVWTKEKPANKMGKKNLHHGLKGKRERKKATIRRTI